MTTIACIEDLRRKAKQRVPRMFYEYADSGSWSESTYRANEDDLQALKFRQRVAIDVSVRSTNMTMLGENVSMPVALAPIGLTGMQYADGEILAAKAARDFGVPFTLSTMSICSIEDVAEHSSAPFWFQLYVMRDREFIRRLVDRARDAKCSALMKKTGQKLLDGCTIWSWRNISPPTQTRACRRFSLRNLCGISVKCSNLDGRFWPTAGKTRAMTS